MIRLLYGLFFLVFMTSLVVGVHYYMYRRLAVDTQLSSRLRATVRLALIVLAAGLPLTMLLQRALPMTWARVLLQPWFVWMGMMFLLVWLLLASEGARLILWGSSKLLGTQGLADPGRRRLFARAVAGGALALASGSAAYALRQALGRLEVKRVEVPLPRLQRALDGFTIVQLTDLHIGVNRSGVFLKEVVERVNSLSPDIVAITGDLVDGTVGQLESDLACLAELKPRHGTYFVTGNHEYYSGAPEWVAHLGKLGVRVLRNERVAISRDGATFDLAGVDDYNARRMAPGHVHDPDRALAGRDPRRAAVLLAHQPRSVHAAARHGVGLVLAGHTHGGQIWPMELLVHLQQPYVRGLARHKGTWIYVSSGTGFWGPPLRLGSTAEITRVVLRSEEKAKA
ncbi:MAG: metallophosphoesterase [Polyangia bacterium]|jgi:predicted MPP superfamily phosphohydrolase|nr:metallophosphoesterase [Polyangia bacterium]